MSRINKLKPSFRRLYHFCSDCKAKLNPPSISRYCITCLQKKTKAAAEEARKKRVKLIIACDCGEEVETLPYKFFDYYCSECVSFPVIIGVIVNDTVIKPYHIKDGSIFNKIGLEVEDSQRVWSTKPKFKRRKWKGDKL